MICHMLSADFSLHRGCPGDSSALAVAIMDRRDRLSSRFRSINLDTDIAATDTANFPRDMSSNDPSALSLSTDHSS